MSVWQADAFWAYSLERYQQPGIKAACLALQDDFGLNINMLLLCDYLRAQGRVLRETDMQQLLSTLSSCAANVERLRAKRRQAKLADAETYQSLLAQELAAEKQQQAVLISGLNTLTLGDDGIDPIQQYVRTLRTTETPQLLAWLAAFDGTPQSKGSEKDAS